MEARLERANNRYGMPPLWLRAYHACNNGLVEESRKYGRPTVAASSARIVADACPAPAGFQLALGMMGSAARLTARTQMCRMACLRPASLECSQWAYAYPSTSTS